MALALAVVLLDGRHVWAAGAALVAAGLCGPLLTGGISSLVAGLGGAGGRAYALDAVTYGVAGSAGPAAVAALAAALSPVVALWTVAAAVLLAAVLVRSLPVPPRNPAQPPAMDGSAGTLLLTVRPLRRVTLTTMAAAATGGALAIAAVLLAVDLTGHGERGAWLISAVGIGNLAGSSAVLARPLRGDPVRWSIVLAAALGVGYLLVGVAPDYPVALVVRMVLGLVTAPWVTATLASRDAHAPAGRRAQVFVAMAGWKVAAAAAGSALAGAASAWGPRSILVTGAALTLVCAAVAALDRARR